MEEKCLILEEYEDYKKFIKSRLVKIKSSIKWVIENNIHNKEFIQKKLYELLESLPLKIGDEEFHELNNFYLKIDNTKAKEWKEYYEKITKKKY